jgi:hypothetical protein
MEDHDRHGDSTMVGPSVAPMLEIVRGNEKGKTVRLKLKTQIGRERDNDVVLTDPRVSRYHTLIELVNGQWLIQDLGSANGTLVNDQPAGDRQALAADDRITVGDTHLVFQPSQLGAPHAAPTGAPQAEERAPRGLPERISPRWSPAWLAGAAILLVALAGVIIFAFLRSGRPVEEATERATTSPDAVPEDFGLVYEDDFSDPGSGWDDAFDRYTTKQYGNNKYYIEVTTSNLVAWGLANRNVGDFRLEVDTAQETGPNNNGYGILFRFQDRDNFYRFDVSGDGFFLLSKFHDGEWVTLVPWTASSAINVGEAANRLAVEAIGNQIRVYANDRLLSEVEDEAFTGGNFGFFASTFSEPNLTVSFDDIKLWTPKGQEVAIIPTATPTRFVRATPTPMVTGVTAESAALATTEAPPTATVEPETPAAETATAEPEETPTAGLSTPEGPLGTPTVTPTAEPLPEYVSRDLPPPRNAVALAGRFVFPVFDAAAGTYHIFAADPDGGNRRLVVAEASQPDVGAGGQRITYRSWKVDSRGLTERGIAGGDTWRFNTFFEAARPTFSPDGQMLLFHSRQAGDTPAIYRTLGTEHLVLRRDGSPIQGEAPAWTPDGRFVYKGCLGASCGLILTNLDGSFPVQLTYDPGDTNPAVSPDGKTVAFMSQRSGDWDVYSVNIDGTDLAQLTSDSGNDGLPAWAPNGSALAFVSDRDGTWEVWAMDPDGENQRPLFEMGGSVDGRVQSDFRNARGWLEERIVWSAAAGDQ